MKTFKDFSSLINEAITVSKSSEDHYEWVHGHKPKGGGSWAFSTVHPKKHDAKKHDTTFVQANSYTDAKKKAIAQYKEKGHTGEIHTLS